MSAVEAVEVTVTGRVQGVFFRDSCATQARRLGVTGWIGNEPDGSVRGHFEGPGEALEELVGWCRTGPPRAEVAEVSVSTAGPTGAREFESR